MSKKLRVFEAFAGYGSQSIALRNIGVNYEVVAISEIDKYAIQAYEAIHGAVNNLGDISKISVDDIPEHDLFTYSFPCTDISLAGKQQGLTKGETRSGLLWECERLISNKKPRYLMMENVKNLIGKKFKGDFDRWCDWLKTQGYVNYYKVINSSDMDTPQSRERVFMISILGDVDYKFPTNKLKTKTFGDLLELNVDSKYYLTAEKMSAINNWKSYQNPFDRLVGKSSICPTLTARGAGEYHSGAIILGDCDFNKNIRDEIKLNPQHAQNKYKPRFLTPRESFRFMGVNDLDYNKLKFIPERQLYKLAGNSIVVQVLEEIFKNLLQEYI